MIPMDVNRQYMKKDEKVVDFDLSCDGLVYYTGILASLNCQTKTTSITPDLRCSIFQTSL